MGFSCVAEAARRSIAAGTTPALAARGPGAAEPPTPSRFNSPSWGAARKKRLKNNIIKALEKHLLKAGVPEGRYSLPQLGKAKNQVSQTLELRLE